MKAILEFDLSDNDEAMEHLRCVKALDMALALWEIATNIKRDLEDDIIDGEVQSKYDILDLVFDRINDCLEERDINIDKLVI